MNVRGPLRARSIRDALLGLAIAGLASLPATAGIGSALDFGGSDYVEVDDTVEVSGPLTIEAWILFRGTTGHVVSNKNSFGGYELGVIDLGTHVALRFRIGNSTYDATITGYQGAWVHVAATWAGEVDGTVTLYLDGESVATYSHELAQDTMEGSLWIGSRNATQFFFDGVIDELRVWSTDLDEATIASWRTQVVDGSHPEVAALEGYWRFEEGTGQAAASEVSSPTRDGVLGSTSGEDDRDPAWSGGVVPTASTSVSGIKARFLESSR